MAAKKKAVVKKAPVAKKAAVRADWKATLAPTVEAYLALLPAPHKKRLSELRKLIRAAAPEAEERISYRVPTFHHAGPLVCFSASPDHCALHLMSPPLVKALADDVRDYLGSTATLHFDVDQPLPAKLVTKLVKARIAENEARKKR